MYRILIVDDEPLILAGISSLLPWEEYQCRIVGKAANGCKALDLYWQLRPDIVITDIKMPAMDGITFMKKSGRAEAVPPLSCLPIWRNLHWQKRLCALEPWIIL